MKSAMLPVLVLLATVGVAAERPSSETSAARLIRLVGHPGPRGERAPAAELTLDVRGQAITFQAERVDVLRGNVLGADVLAELAPNRPSLRVYGSAPVLDKLRAATADDQVEITGYHRPGSRDLLVSDVTVKPAKKP